MERLTGVIRKGNLLKECKLSLRRHCQETKCSKQSRDPIKGEKQGTNPKNTQEPKKVRESPTTKTLPSKLKSPRVLYNCKRTKALLMSKLKSLVSPPKDHIPPNDWYLHQKLQQKASVIATLILPTMNVLQSAWTSLTIRGNAVDRANRQKYEI